MGRLRFFQSVVFQLIFCLILGGVVISLGLGVLEMRRSEAMLEMEITQRAMLTTRNIQSALRGLIRPGQQRSVREVLGVFLNDGRIRAVRVSASDTPRVVLGDWPEQVQKMVIWSLTEHGMALGHEVAIDKLTLIRAPYLDQDRAIRLEILIDGPAARRQLQAKLLNQMALQMLLLAMVVLMGLLLLRRWFTGPLSEISHLVAKHAGPEPFFRVAAQMRGEFAQLAQAVGGMLTRLDAANLQIRNREHAFENLYHYAPAAMVSLDEQGSIVQANRRAALLFHFRSEKELLGRRVQDFIRQEDRGVFRQNIDRLGIEDASRCHLRLITADKELDVSVESTAVRDEEGVLQSVRLSLLDVSEAIELQQELAGKSRLLNLVIDHMSDAMLLVDAHGVIGACNEPMAQLLAKRPGALVGQPYDPETFWLNLGVADHDVFVGKLRQIEAEKQRPAQERFESRAGTFQIQGIPVHDSLGVAIGRLWVARDITSQEQSEKLAHQQARQLQALKHMGHELGATTGLDDLLDHIAAHLYDVLGVEAVGMALRSNSGTMRSKQILHRGGGSCLLGPNRQLMQAAEQYLMPQVLARQDITLWSELPAGEPWSAAFKDASLTSLAGCPLTGNGEAKGILWIARRGGEHIGRHHIFLMEALAPLIIARLEIAQLYDRMHRLELTDSVTTLPDVTQFRQELARLYSRPGLKWSLMCVKIDHFRQINEQLDHDAADQLLRDVGNLIRNHARGHCIISRIRGPVFGLIAPEYDHAQALKLVTRLHQVLGEHRVKVHDASSGQEALRNITVSLGMVCCPDDGQDVRELYDLAMARMELARRTGGNKCITQGSGMTPDRRAG
jgi:diguanylate cyclase (GGDEF)-like protein/PAS domain S-box-containing protein